MISWVPVTIFLGVSVVLIAMAFCLYYHGELKDKRHREELLKKKELEYIKKPKVKT